MAVAPLTLPEFSAILEAIGGFEARPLVAVAVSGGPDSMALMLLADRWARRQGGRAWGLTVDHGLRHGSADEARMVAAWLGAQAIPHEILSWAGPKPTSGVQAAAREARYRLLVAWCEERGVLHLFAAHHLDDQIETHLIRRRARSGIDGLAGMSAVRELAGCRLVRPLLGLRRERLTALLAAERQPFLRDPSNVNPAFERARLRLTLTRGSPSLPSRERGRAALYRNAGEGMTDQEFEALSAAVRARARERISREQAVNRLAAGAVALHPAGFGSLDPASLAAADPEIAGRLLSRLILCLGGLRYPARGARLARLLAALVAEPRQARTLGGCRFVPWRGRLLVLRELAAAEAPVALEPGARLRWDRRFAIGLAPSAAGSITVGYLGQYDGAAPEGRFATLPPLVRSVLPAFWDAKGLVAVPHFLHARPGPRILSQLSFWPDKPLIPPSFTVV